MRNYRWFGPSAEEIEEKEIEMIENVKEAKVLCEEFEKLISDKVPSTKEEQHKMIEKLCCYPMEIGVLIEAQYSCYEDYERLIEEFDLNVSEGMLVDDAYSITMNQIKESYKCIKEQIKY